MNNTNTRKFKLALINQNMQVIITAGKAGGVLSDFNLIEGEAADSGSALEVITKMFPGVEMRRIAQPFGIGSASDIVFYAASYISGDVFRNGDQETMRRWVDIENAVNLFATNTPSEENLDTMLLLVESMKTITSTKLNKMQEVIENYNNRLALTF